MAQTTTLTLESLISTLNERNGLPQEPHVSGAEKYTPNPLNLHLVSQNGCYGLDQIASDGHGSRSISGGMSKRELENFLRGMIAQIYVAEELAKK